VLIEPDIVDVLTIDALRNRLTANVKIRYSHLGNPTFTAAELLPLFLL